MRTLAAALMLLALTTSAGANENAWKEVDDDDGIRVWARDVPGSSIREVKAMMELDIAPERIWDVLVDCSKYVEFMPYVIDARVLSQDGDRVEYQYQLIDPPFVDKRDYVLRVEKQTDPQRGVYTRSWKVAQSDKAPPKPEDVVRLDIVEGQWHLERTAGGKTRVQYYLFTNPGGSIPSWMGNKANSTSVPALMEAVRKRSADPKYRRG